MEIWDLEQAWVQLLAINSDYRRSLLEGLELFQGVNPDDIAEMLVRCGRRDLAAGDILLSPGHHNEFLYIVLSGSLTVHVGSPEYPELATMEPGACVGEMSIIEDRDPSAWVVGSENSHLLEIHQTTLWEMVNASHELAKNLLVVLSERVRSHNRVIADSFGELRKAEQSAVTDALTGLGNRHTMEHAFPATIERCVRDARPISLLMLDLDNFKVLNDRFGHIAGDRVLATVAEILKTQFRPSDVLVRYGGDEFAVLLPHANATQACVIAERVREAVIDSEMIRDKDAGDSKVSVSIGVAELTEGQTLDSFLESADEALYRAKRSGRNAVST